jgi:hypothetical protein
MAKKMTMLARRYGWIVCSLLTAAAPAACLAAPPAAPSAAAAALDRYEQSLVPLARLTAHAVETGEDRVASTDGKSDSLRRSVHDVLIRYDDPRLYLKVSIKTTVGGKPVAGGHYETEDIAGTKENFRIQDQPEMARSMNAAVAKEHPIDHVLRAKYLGPLFGYVQGNASKTVAQLLRGAKQLQQLTSPTSVDGTLVDTVEAVTAYGRVTVSVGR